MRGAGILSLLAFLPVAVATVPHAHGETRLGAVVVGSGGAAATGAAGSAVLTFGQPVVGTSAGNTAGLDSGFWPGVTPSVPTPVRLAWFRAVWTSSGVDLTWRAVDDAADLVGFHVHRHAGDGPREQLTAEWIRGAEEFWFTDPSPPAGRVSYWLEEWSRTGERTWHGPVTLEIAGSGAPTLALMPAVPNPTRGSARIAFQVPAAGQATLRIFDQRGRLVATLLDEHLAAGVYETAWSGHDKSGRPVAAGIYFTRLDVDAGGVTRKLIVLQ